VHIVRQGSSKSNRSSRSEQRMSGPASPKLDRHPSLRFSVKRQPATSGTVASASSGQPQDAPSGSGCPDPYTILTTLQQQVRKSSPVEFAASHDVMAAVGLSPRGSHDELAKALLGATGWWCAAVVNMLHRKKSQLPQTDPHHALPRAHRVVHKGGRSV